MLSLEPHNLKFRPLTLPPSPSASNQSPSPHPDTRCTPPSTPGRGPTPHRTVLLPTASALLGARMRAVTVRTSGRTLTRPPLYQHSALDHRPRWRTLSNACAPTAGTLDSEWLFKQVKFLSTDMQTAALSRFVQQTMWRRL